MRITAIRLQRLVVPLDPPFPAAWDPEPRTRFPATIVRVETDEGVVGIGSGDTMDGFEAFEHLFIGQDPLAVARHVRVLETIDFHAGRYWPLEVALWDIVGKVAGLPVATLFGGASDGIPAYASCGSLLPPAARAESALRLREEGFTALKIRVDPRRIDDGLAAVAATRAAVGDTMAIMVDLNQGWRMAGDTSPTLGPTEARRVVAQLAEYDVLWVEATEALAEALQRHGLEYGIKEGDAAFYGPKIDIDVRDAIGRSWQLSTIQLDFNQPERFELEYVGADNERHRPIMLHRALFGSIERFFGVLIEHYAGAFPTWLAPLQVRVLPVSTAHEEYARRVTDRVAGAGARVDMVGAGDALGKRIRSSKLDKIPYILVVGDDDVAANTVGVNPRGGEVERGVGVDTFIARFTDEVAETAARALNA